MKWNWFRDPDGAYKHRCSTCYQREYRKKYYQEKKKKQKAFGQPMAMDAGAANGAKKREDHLKEAKQPEQGEDACIQVERRPLLH
jgi:hypothetical protein